MEIVFSGTHLDPSCYWLVFLVFILFLSWTRSQVPRCTECNAEVQCKEVCGCTFLNLRVKNCEGSEISSYLQATKLGCFPFMLKEDKGLLGLRRFIVTALTVARVWHWCQFPKSVPTMQYEGNPVGPVGGPTVEEFWASRARVFYNRLWACLPFAL